MSAPVDVLAVTPDQYEQIEAAWRICSGGTRRVSGPMLALFDSCVAQVLGFVPPTQYALAKFGEG